MRIEIADELLKDAQISESDLKLELALLFYKQNIFTLGQAGKFADLHQMEVQRKLMERKIPLHYDLECFKEDLETIKKF